jgi:hypothetical protein
MQFNEMNLHYNCKTHFIKLSFYCKFAAITEKSTLDLVNCPPGFLAGNIKII